MKKRLHRASKLTCGPVLQMVNRTFSKAARGGQVQAALRRARKFMTETTEVVRDGHSTTETRFVTDLEKLHSAKLEIDQMLEASGVNSLGPYNQAAGDGNQAGPAGTDRRGQP